MCSLALEILPSPRNSYRLALGTGLVSAALVVTWVLYEASLGRGPGIPSATLFAVASLGLFAAPVLALLALVWLRMYRVQTEPSRGRRRATLAVGAAILPGLAVLAWAFVGVILALLG
ncbi:MAG TPA: hypothetical protein VGB53_03570 [Rubricoccaceae bacterium]|jgi:DMSO/TMAO reductase YedYZ heme-binding membrane subunit